MKEEAITEKERFEKHVELITRLGESMVRRLLAVSEKNNEEKLDTAHAIRDYSRMLNPKPKHKRQDKER